MVTVASIAGAIGRGAFCLAQRDLEKAGQEEAGNYPNHQTLDFPKVKLLGLAQHPSGRARSPSYGERWADVVKDVLHEIEYGRRVLAWIGGVTDWRAGRTGPAGLGCMQ